MHGVPYVDSRREVRRGTLISSLTMAGDTTVRPDTHVVYFDGDRPCSATGRPIAAIAHHEGDIDLGHGVRAKFGFSSKPDEGYTDYFHKMTTYASILSGPAATLQRGVTAKTYAVPDEDEDNVFNYVETASDRAGIGALTDLLADERVGIIGVGGTGGYVLDFVAKTPVQEIRIFDGDVYLQHNAFRSPGAPSIEDLRDAPRKVDYLSGIYSRMHRRITAHPVHLTPENVDLLDGITFAFISMDAGDAKRAIVAKLEEIGASFVDVGMGLELVDGSLGGILRVTASTPEQRSHVHEGRISFAGGGADDVYTSNIQVADLNALNAILAVVKWKKIRGFYRDLEREHHCTYTTDGNMLVNGDLG